MVLMPGSRLASSSFRSSLRCSSSTSRNSVAWVNSTRGMSFSRIWPCSPADSTTSRPLPSSRSSRPFSNDTSLILASGMSRPCLVTMPDRTRSRRVVSS